MKRIITIILLACIALSGMTVYADETEKYTITYYSDTNEEFFSTRIPSKTTTVTYNIIKDIPVKEGYSFEGWRSETDSTGKAYGPGQSVKIFGSTDFVALWRRENSKVISYTDGGREILPRQLVLEEMAAISELIPKKAGKIFCGWSVEGSKELLKPGQQWEVKKDAKLTAVWENGNLPIPVLEVVQQEGEAVTFSLAFPYGGAMSYTSYEVISQNLITGEERQYEIYNGSISIDGLPAGQYRARLSAKKVDIEYYSSWVNFAVLSGKTVPENPLKLFLDGKELVFSETPPALVNGYTYIALRHFCESMGARVEWSEENQGATITLGSTVIKVFNKSKKCIVNGTVETLPAETIIMGSRMMLPLRSVAELCKAEIIWDDNRTVYIYKKSEGFFEENMVHIKNQKGEFLGVDENGLSLKYEAEPGCAWLFNAVDAKKGIFEIYNLNDFSKTLQVKKSEIKEGQGLALEENRDFDDYLWKVTEDSDGGFIISPANNSKYSIDAENLCLTEKEVKVDIVHVNNQ